MIHVISMDLWKTLVYPHPDYALHRAEVVARTMGWTVSPPLIAAAFKQAAREMDALTEESGGTQYNLSDRAQRICEILGQPALDDRQMRKLYATLHTAQLQFPPIFMEPDLPDTLRQIKQRGFKLAVISNTGNSPGSTLSAVLAHRGVLQYFDYRLWSDEIGVAKPSRAIFDHLVRASQVQPSSILHVGDNRITDYEGSRAAGLNALQYVPQEPSGPDTYARHSELLSHPMWHSCPAQARA